MNSTCIHLPNGVATHALGRQLGQQLPVGAVLLLRGELGSGKTTLVQGLGQGLGLSESVTSPTFTLINEYTGGRLPLYHVDLYRLAGAEADALSLETYWEGIEVEPGIVAIEWAERLRFLPDDPLRIDLTYDGEGRKATLTPVTQTQAHLLESLHALLADEV